MISVYLLLDYTKILYQSRGSRLDAVVNYRQLQNKKELIPEFLFIGFQ